MFKINHGCFILAINMSREEKIREIQALVSLIDEPDQKVFDEISSQIHSFGPEVIPFLEAHGEAVVDALAHKRIERLIHEINFEEIVKEFETWVSGGCVELLPACILVARYRYPAILEEDIFREINKIRKEIWLELNENLTALEQIRVFNHVFYEVQGFGGNTDNYHSPQNSYINKVLENRKGNPLSIGIIYMHIAQSLDMPVFGINLPEHFVLAYTGTEPNPYTLEKNKQVVLFYINAFSRGAVFSRQDVELFLKQLNLPLNPDFFLPCRNPDIIKRMLNNLVNAYEKEGTDDRVAELDRLRKILDKR